MPETSPTQDRDLGDEGTDEDTGSDAVTSTGSPADTDHPTGQRQAAENDENELPG